MAKAKELRTRAIREWLTRNGNAGTGERAVRAAAALPRLAERRPAAERRLVSR